MYNVSTIQTALNGLVGFQNPINPTFAIVNTANETATSGRYFTDSPFVKIEVLKSIQDYKDANDADFNEFLSRVKNKSITSVIDKVFDKPDFIDRQVLYKNENNKVNTDSLPDGFVGYEIYVSNQKNYCFEIKRDLLEFEGTGDVTILLYNSAKREPIQSKTVSVTSRFQEVELNWKIDNTDVYKGRYFYGYQTNGVTILPIRREYETADIMSKITGLYIDNIQVVYTPTTNEIFDLHDVDGSSETWGMNPDIIVYEDYTDFITQNARLFSRAIQLQGQIFCLSEYLSTLRVNRTEMQAEQMLNRVVLELEGQDDVIKKKGLKSELIGEIAKLSKEVYRLQQGFGNIEGIKRVTRC